MRLQLSQTVHTGIILRFCDADTVKCILKVGLDCWREISVRLPGIESWEPNSADRAKVTAAVYRLNEAFAQKLCYVDVLRRSFDRNGRLLGRITIDDLDLAEHIVTLGLAWRVERNHTHANPKPITTKEPCNASTTALRSAPCSPASSLSQVAA